MKKAKVIYKSKDVVRVKYARAPEYIAYSSIITIKNSGQAPISIQLTFDDIPTYIAPMPPHQHKIQARSLIELFLKINRWFKKYGYAIY